MGKAFEESFYKRRRFRSSPPYSYNRAAGGRKSRIEGSYRSFPAIPERPLLAGSCLSRRAAMGWKQTLAADRFRAEADVRNESDF